MDALHLSCRASLEHCVYRPKPILVYVCLSGPISPHTPIKIHWFIFRQRFKDELWILKRRLFSRTRTPRSWEADDFSPNIFFSVLILNYGYSYSTPGDEAPVPCACRDAPEWYFKRCHLTMVKWPEGPCIKYHKRHLHWGMMGFIGGYRNTETGRALDSDNAGLYFFENKRRTLMENSNNIN